MTRAIVVPLLVSVAACGAHAPRMAMRAPNPNGCYVMLFREPAFGAAGDVLNGPGEWPTLDTLRVTVHSRWGNEIRSLRLGSAARLVAYAEAGFKGPAATFAAGSEHPSLEPPMAANIESIELACLGN